MDLANFTLVLGAAASGKSGFAEALLRGSGRALVYLATAEVYDDEMRSKVDRHIAMRGAGWRTVEAPLDLAPALADAAPHEAVLIDCATMWLSNHMGAKSDLPQATDALIGAIGACAAPVVVVTNEVGGGIVPDNALARRFRDAQGTLNQILAAQADAAVLVAAGLPLWLKGAP